MVLCQPRFCQSIMSTNDCREYKVHGQESQFSCIRRGYACTCMPSHARHGGFEVRVHSTGTCPLTACTQTGWRWEILYFRLITNRSKARPSMRRSRGCNRQHLSVSCASSPSLCTTRCKQGAQSDWMFNCTTRCKQGADVQL